MIKRLIFDIDNTIITGVDFKIHIEKALREYGINDLEKLKIYLNNIKEYEKCHKSYEKDSYLSFFSKKLDVSLNEDFLRLLFSNLKNAVPKDNKKVESLIRSLYNNYELVLLSNYFEESQRNRLESMNINKFFSEYYGESIIKPNKETYFQAAGKNRPSECIMIGDDIELDINVPKSLGFNTIYINKKNGDIERLTDIKEKILIK